MYILLKSRILWSLLHKCNFNFSLNLACMYVKVPKSSDAINFAKIVFLDFSPKVSIHYYKPEKCMAS